MPSATAQSYDARGNRTTGSLGYDIYNNLTSGPSSASFAFDPAGRLFLSVGAVTTRFLYDGAQIVGEYDGSGNLLRRYVPGPGLDEPLVWYEGAGVSDRRWLAADERGSVIATMNAAGAALAINAYDEFGIPASSNSGRFGFAGAAWLPEALLYHMRARAYAPQLGRFQQADPALHAGGMNLYAYVGNDPVNFTDPLGLQRLERGFTLHPINHSRSSGPRASVGLGGVREGIGPDGFDTISPVTSQRTNFGIGGFTGGLSGVVVAGTNESGGAGHDYTATNKVCDAALSPSQQVDVLSRFAYPGQNPSQPAQNGSINLVRDPRLLGAPGGFVTTTFSNGGRTVRNATTPVHVVAGIIDRSIYSDSGGTYITTHGTGTHPGVFVPPPIAPLGAIIPGDFFDAVNQAQGPGIFNAVDRAAAEHLDENVEGC